MPYSVEAKNAMLDALGALATHLTVHDANPGSTGANEASGSVRGAITWAAASGGSKAQSGTVSVTDVPIGFVVRYVGLRGASPGGTWYGYQAVSEVDSALGTTWTFVAVSGVIDLASTVSA
jgi:hypothetical protein